jgi:hypothetical protein
MDKQGINQDHKAETQTLYPDISQIPYQLTEPLQQGFNPNPSLSPPKQ